MPLRGHRDDSKYYDDKGNNPGNFQVMLEYRARSGDTVVAEHLKRTKENNGGRNCTYRSKTIQNEVIKCFEQELRGIIIPEGGLPYVGYKGMCHRPGSIFHFQKSEQAPNFEVLLQNRPYFLKVYSRTGFFFDNLVSNAQLKCQNPSCFQLLFPAA